jgi:hypothetical protein
MMRRYVVFSALMAVLFWPVVWSHAFTKAELSHMSDMHVSSFQSMQPVNHGPIQGYAPLPVKQVKGSIKASTLPNQPKPNPDKPGLDLVTKPISLPKMAKKMPRINSKYTDSPHATLSDLSGLMAHHQSSNHPDQESLPSKMKTQSVQPHQMDPAVLYQALVRLEKKQASVQSLESRLDHMEQSLDGIKILLKHRLAEPRATQNSVQSINWPAIIPFFLALMMIVLVSVLSKKNTSPDLPKQRSPLSGSQDQEEYDFLGSAEGRQAQLDLLRAYHEMGDQAALNRVNSAIRATGDDALIAEADSILKGEKAVSGAPTKEVPKSE